jgi:hypothetical protein
MFTKAVSVKLSTPIKWEGREIAEIVLDFNKINGTVLNKCERESSGNLTAAMRPVSTEYTSRLASMISGVSFRVIEKLPYEDFELICTVVQRYLTKDDPQEYYDEYISEKVGFTIPAALPESTTTMALLDNTESAEKEEDTKIS